MSDSSTRLSSMAVLGGPLHGKTLQLSESPEEITIGSDPSCRFHLDIPGVSALHARIVADESGAAVFDSPGSRGLFLNFEKVEGRAALSDGDMLRLGPPQERDSVMIQLEFGGALLDIEPPIFASTETPSRPPHGRIGSRGARVRVGRPRGGACVRVPCTIPTLRSSPSCRRPTTMRSSSPTSTRCPRCRRRRPISRRRLRARRSSSSPLSI